VVNNELSLEVSDAPNVKVLRVFDTSYWAGDAIENYLIEVLPVNRSKWVTFHVQKGFSLAMNSSSLGYRRVADDSQLVGIPDGIYEIKQSYKPNIHTLQHYYHLRVAELRKKIRSEWDKLVDNTCKISREEFNTNRDKLRDIEEYLLAAKYKVEECHQKKEGKELYEWAVKQLEIYTNECQC
jgi:hypothetical protein